MPNELYELFILETDSKHLEELQSSLKTPIIYFLPKGGKLGFSYKLQTLQQWRKLNGEDEVSSKATYKLPIFTLDGEEKEEK